VNEVWCLMISRVNNMKSPGHIRAFTLIEVLVVVGIIAMLAAILIPSLQRAREQAKVATCKANCKQIGTLTATYQSEHKGFVPILFNYGAEERGFHDHPEHYAAYAYLPVAFRSYEKGLKNLSKMQASDGTSFKPTPNINESWQNSEALWWKEKRQEFERGIMPQHYACPFGRDKGGAEFEFVGTTSVSNEIYDLTLMDGKVNAYVTWMWEGRIVKDEIPLNLSGQPEQYPTDPGGIVNGPIDGRPKYSVFSWNYLYLTKQSYRKAFQPPEFISRYPRGGDGDDLNPRAKILKMHRQWQTKDAQRQKAASFSEMTTLYCQLGKHMASQASRGGHSNKQIRNPESHRGSLGGGTNVVFADTHVEWVKGTQVGWE